MKKLLLFLFLFPAYLAQAQIGVGTTSPHSTLDVRGAFATPITNFSGNTTAGGSDNLLVFTGTSAATLTLPTAVGISGREYWVKNASSNGSTLTIATTSSQTIDGITSWTLTQQYKAIRLVSNGSNWYATNESLPGSTGTPWVLGGNNVGSMQNIGTTSNYALPFITNNTEKMRIATNGDVAIGVSTWDATNPEQLLVDAGTTSSINVISGKGSINNYLQLNIQNRSNGSAASSDIVATADNGSESSNYVDLGINSSAYSSSGVLGGANTAYLYSAGSDFVIGNSISNKNLMFFTGGTATTNERMRINSNGNVAIGTTSWDATNPEKVIVDAGTSTSVNLIKAVGNANVIVRNSVKNSSSGTGAGADFRVYNNNDNTVVLGINSSGYSGSSIYHGAGDAQLYSSANDFVIGNTVASKNLRFYTGGVATTNERMRISGTGDVAIGTTTWDATYPEKLLVDAGTTSSINVISGKGTINNYLQLNIQNKSTGTAASSDVVATANNGTETVNYIDMGINGGGNTSAGILGGANTAYLYATGNDFVIGNGTDNKNLIFYTSVSGTGTEKMRITSAGNVGVANTSPTEKLDVTGNIRFSGALMPNNSAGTSGYVLQSNGAGAAPTWVSLSGIDWALNGNSVAALKTLGTTSNYDLPFITNNTEKMRIATSGSVGIGTTTFSGTNPERLLVDAGASGGSSYQNVIVGKGNTNSYAQLNIQNSSTGTAASSDVVATANNGSETVNFIDMGINGGGNTSAGILGGANTAYLYATGNDFVIGNGTDNKNLIFYTSVSGTGTERVRITSGGLMGVGNITPNSTFEVSGSTGYSITTTSSNITLDATHRTVIITGGTPTVTLPAAGSTNTRRIYVIVNQTGAARTISTYKDLAGANATTIAATSSITIQSDGTNWYRIQ